MVCVCEGFVQATGEETITGRLIAFGNFGVLP